MPEGAIDTETHVALRLFPIEWNPQVSRVKPYVWHEHSGDLLIDEMNRAEVDLAFLINYDGEDSEWFLKRAGGDANDLVAGRKYVLDAVQRHPGRLLWFNTVKHPERHDVLALANADFSDGATGLKIFPAYLGLDANNASLMQLYRLCEETDRRVILSFEDAEPPTTRSLPEFFEQLDHIASSFPQLRIQLNHGGCADPLTDEGEPLYEIVHRHPLIWLSTSFLGLTWPDETEYPFPQYLERLRVLRDSVGIERLMWGTDWPWTEEFMKYPQARNAVARHASFLSPDDIYMYFRGNAESFLGSLLPNEDAQSERS